MQFRSQSFTYSSYTEPTKHELIKANSTLNITENGAHVIKNIGDNAVINKNNSDNLIITGTVGENVKFNISGKGKIIFEKKPPQSVMNIMECSGKYQVIVENQIFMQSESEKKANQPSSGSYAKILKKTAKEFRRNTDIPDNDALADMLEELIHDKSGSVIVNRGGSTGMNTGYSRITSGNGYITQYLDKDTSIATPGKLGELINNEMYVDGKRVEVDHDLLNTLKGENEPEQRTIFSLGYK